MTDLSGQRILVAGGAGEVGEGITRQLLKAGATVIVPSRNADKLANLTEWVGGTDDNLITIEGSIGTIEGAQAIRDSAGDIDHVIASLGGWWQGQAIPDIELDLWHNLIDNSLTAHFVTAKTFLPHLKDNASYTLINGGAALHTMPNVAPITISASAQLRLAEVIAVENPSLRVNSLVLNTPVITRSRPTGQDGWLSADDAGRYCVYLAGDDATETGKTIVFDSVRQIPV